MWEPWPHEVSPLDSSVSQMGKGGLQEFRYGAKFPQTPRSGGEGVRPGTVDSRRTLSLSAYHPIGFLLWGEGQDSED